MGAALLLVGGLGSVVICGLRLVCGLDQEERERLRWGGWLRLVFADRRFEGGANLVGGVWWMVRGVWRMGCNAKMCVVSRTPSGCW